MNTLAIMDGIKKRFQTIPNLEVYDYVAHSITPPAVVIPFPNEVVYDLTYGSNRITWEVYVMVGQADDISSTHALANLIDQFQTIIDGDPTLEDSVSTARATRVDVEVMDVGGIDFLTAVLAIDIVTKGN